MKNLIIIIFTLISINIKSQEQSFQLKITLNNKELNEKYSMIIVNYNSSKVETFNDVSSDTIIKIKSNEICELRIKSNNNKSTTNRIIINNNIFNSNTDIILVEIDLLNKSKYMSNQINEGLLFYNYNEQHWELYNNSEITF